MAINKESVLKYWNALSPGRKRYAVIGLLVIVISIITAIGYLNRRARIAPTPNSRDANKVDLQLDRGLLETSQYREQEYKSRERDEQMRKLQTELDDIKKNIGNNKSPAPAASMYPKVPLPGAFQSKGTGSNSPQELAQNAEGSTGNREMQMKSPQPYTPLPPLSNKLGIKGPEAPALVGDIEIVSLPNSNKPASPGASADSIKKKAEKIYLPPSYMEASLLSGLDAPTVESARGNPVPVLIRVKNLAQLPNKVRADLKGCFVIADGLGNLADERAHLRLISLTCLSKNGSAIIDQEVKGFVVDADGKIGLQGKVVAKMGAMLARDMIAGFFGGIGDAMKQASTISQISPIGTTQTINSADMLRTAAGGGIADAAHDLQKFYLKLAEATLPVIEIGAARDITLVISKGVDLEIKNFCGRGNTLEGKCSE